MMITVDFGIKYRINRFVDHETREQALNELFVDTEH